MRKNASQNAGSKLPRAVRRESHANMIDPVGRVATVRLICADFATFRRGCWRSASRVAGSRCPALAAAPSSTSTRSATRRRRRCRRPSSRRRIATRPTSTPPPRSICTRRARKAAYAEYQDAIEYGRKAEELANRARAIAVSDMAEAASVQPAPRPRAQREEPRTAPNRRADRRMSRRSERPRRLPSAARAARVVLAGWRSSARSPLAAAGCAGTAAARQRARGARDRQGGARQRRLQVRAARAGAGRDAPRVRRAASSTRATTSAPASTCSIADHNAREAYRLARACAQVRAGQAAARQGPRRHPRQRRQVPDEPEDKDGFEDEDGCPDLDNDKDGIPDTDGQVPERARGQGRVRGRRRLPRSRTTTPTASPTPTDKCPNEPEDKDGFEDEDGCPDPDNDKDGVLDAADKCPNEPGPAGQRRLPEEVRAHRRHPGEDRAQTEDLLRHQQGDHPAAQLLAARRDRPACCKSRPTMTVRIEGHTDSRGNADAQHEAVRRPCGVRAATSGGTGDRSVADGGRRATVPTSRSRPTRRPRGGRRTGAWNSSSRSNSEASTAKMIRSRRPLPGPRHCAGRASLACLSFPRGRAAPRTRPAVEKLVQMNKKALDDYDTLEWESAQADAARGAGGRQEGRARQPPDHGAHVRPPGRGLHHGLQGRAEGVAELPARAGDGSRRSSIAKAMTTPELDGGVRRGAAAAPRGGGGADGRAAAAADRGAATTPSRSAAAPRHRGRPPPARADRSDARRRPKPADEDDRASRTCRPTSTRSTARARTRRCPTSRSLSAARWRPNLPVAKVFLLYLRARQARSSRAQMSKTPKGWFQAKIPKKAVSGKSVQFYFEGRNAAGKPVVANGARRQPEPHAHPRGGGRQEAEAGEAAGASAATRKRTRSRSADRARRAPPAGHASTGRRSASTPATATASGGSASASAAATATRKGDGLEALPQTCSRALRLRARAGRALGHLAPEIGYQLAPDFAISLEGRNQYIPQDREVLAVRGDAARRPCSCKLLHVHQAVARRASSRIAAGGGEGFRLIASPAQGCMPRASTDACDSYCPAAANRRKDFPTSRTPCAAGRSSAGAGRRLPTTRSASACRSSSRSTCWPASRHFAAVADVNLGVPVQLSVRRRRRPKSAAEPARQAEGEVDGSRANASEAEATRSNSRTTSERGGQRRWPRAGRRRAASMTAGASARAASRGCRR